jgi:hypothetical protein
LSDSSFRSEFFGPNDAIKESKDSKEGKDGQINLNELDYVQEMEVE